MREQDLTVFEYRMEKNKKNVEAILHEKLYGKFEKSCIWTETAGYIDFSIYRPDGWKDGRKLPAVFNFHGGGFVLGFYEMDGKYCQRLADLTGCAVINVDYCLAPEFKYPKPILSSYEAVAGIVKQADRYQIDSEKVIVCGHSAGGTIAADLCILDRERKEIGIKGQIIDYAPLKQTISPEERRVLDESKAIKMSRILQYVHWYFDDLDRMKEPLASPLYAELYDLPDMLVIAAEYDSLAEEEEAYACKAKEAGVSVRFELFEGCQHGFTHEELKESNPEQAERAWMLMAEFIKEHI